VFIKGPESKNFSVLHGHFHGWIKTFVHHRADSATEFIGARNISLSPDTDLTDAGALVA
jgi:hypothetical protein